ncbi:MAG: aminotransferase class III-fold pyridoxal phosphate-dependent enzyme [Sphingomonas fennica]
MYSSSLIEADRRHVIQPVSACRAHEAGGATVLTHGGGVYVTDADGRRLPDAIAGPLCATIGYGRCRVVKAAAVMRFVTCHCDATGRPAKKAMTALDRSYRESSSTGAGLTGLPAFDRRFDLHAVIAASCAALRAKVEELGAETVAAVSAEPAEGSAGVIGPPAGWPTAMRQACDDLDVLPVVDEGITGFCRSGPLFACGQEGHPARPDPARKGADRRLCVDRRGADVRVNLRQHRRRSQQPPADRARRHLFRVSDQHRPRAGARLRCGDMPELLARLTATLNDALADGQVRAALT